MARFWDLVTPEGKARLAAWYEEQFGKELDMTAPDQDKRDIRCEPKLESIEEIDKLIRQPPDYTVESKGRGNG